MLSSIEEYNEAVIAAQKEQSQKYRDWHESVRKTDSIKLERQYFKLSSAMSKGKALELYHYHRCYTVISIRMPENIVTKAGQMCLEVTYLDKGKEVTKMIDYHNVYIA